MKKSALVSLFVAAPLLAAPLTWETLIKSADDDARYQGSQKRVNIATSRNTKLWDKLELRYKLDGFSFAQHDFELRMTPKAFGEGSADRAHYEAQMAYANANLAEDRAVLASVSMRLTRNFTRSMLTVSKCCTSSLVLQISIRRT